MRDTGKKHEWANWLPKSVTNCASWFSSFLRFLSLSSFSDFAPPTSPLCSAVIRSITSHLFPSDSMYQLQFPTHSLPDSPALYSGLIACCWLWLSCFVKTLENTSVFCLWPRVLPLLLLVSVCLFSWLFGMFLPQQHCDFPWSFTCLHITLLMPKVKLITNYSCCHLCWQLSLLYCMGSCGSKTKQKIVGRLWPCWF